MLREGSRWRGGRSWVDGLVVCVLRDLYELASIDDLLAALLEQVLARMMERLIVVAVYGGMLMCRIVLRSVFSMAVLPALCFWVLAWIVQHLG